MATVTLLQAEGLATSPNPLTTPAGSLVEAINIQVRRKGLYETRRGFSVGATISALLGRLTTVADKAFFGLFHQMADADNGTIGGIANFVPRDDSLQRINMVAAGDRLWVADRQYTKALGFFGVSGALSTAPAGMPQPGDFFAVGGGTTTTPGWMANNTSVAYRATYVHYLDGRLIESAPNSPTIVTNSTGATRNTSLRLFEQAIPAGVEPQFVRLYRSEAVPSTVTPGDELFLAAEVAYSPVSGIIDIADSQPESLLGPPLYTNPLTGDGILAANGMPPNGVDVELWDGRLWVANIRGPTKATVTLIGVGSPDGLQNNDTIAINGVVYTAKTAPAATTDFLLTTGGSPSANVDTTARALVTTVNNHQRTLSPPVVVARYISGPDEVGVIGFEWQTADGTVGLPVAVSRSTAWQITQQSTVDAKPHGLAFSKADQPDAFPLVNFLLVNTSAAAILRIHALRDKLYVFKTDGLYIVSGGFPYRVDMLDDTAILVSPDAIAQCNGILYALTQQGVVAITDAGVRIVSLPVEQLIRTTMAEAGIGGDFTGANYAENLKEFGRKTFAVAYETERLVQFWLAGALGLTFNSLYGVWTINLAPLVEATLARQMVARPLLTLGTLQRLEWAGVEPASGAMFEWQEFKEWKERKRLDRWDNADEVPEPGSIDIVTEPDPVGFQLPWLFGSGTVLPGDVLQMLSRPAEGAGSDEPPELRLAVRIVSTTGGALLLDAPVAFFAWSLAQAPDLEVTTTVSRPIPVFLRYAPITGGEPQLTKSFREATFHFTDYSVEHADIIATTELVTNLPPDAAQPVEGPKTLWTETRTEAETPILRENKRRLIPRDKARGAQLVIGWAVIEAFCSWVLCGVSVEVDPVSERNSR